jgi:hypothetical protein
MAPTLAQGLVLLVPDCTNLVHHDVELPNLLFMFQDPDPDIGQLRGEGEKAVEVVGRGGGGVDRRHIIGRLLMCGVILLM